MSATSQERKICNDTINIKYQNNKLGKYIGCLNYEGNKEGYGTLYSPDGYIYTQMVMFIVEVLKIIKKKVKENLFIQMGMDLT